MGILRTLVKQVAVATLVVVSQRIAIRIVDKLVSRAGRRKQLAPPRETAFPD
jgi:hypothetical protein